MTWCQGVSLHRSGCAVSVPLVCRSLATWGKWAREDLSDQELPIIDAALSMSESLPCKGSALSSAKLISADHDLIFGGSECPLSGVKRTSVGCRKSLGFPKSDETQSGLLPKPIDQSVEPRSKLVKHVSKNLSFLPACPRRHMKGMIGVRKQF